MPKFKVPQNMDMEDRIIGNLSFGQFGYLVIGFLLAYGAFMKIPTPFNYIVAIPIALLAVACGLLQVNNQSFPKFLVSLFHYVGTPRERIWHKEGGPEEASLIKTDVVKVEKKTTTKKMLTLEEEQRLANLADSHGFSEIDKQ